MVLEYRKTQKAGFSLLEVLVTVSIIALITVLVVVRYSSFNSAVLLKNQAFELALDIREAQVAAVSVRGTGIEFREDHGLMFSLTTPAAYIFFIDDDTDAQVVYDTNPVDERVGVSRTLAANYVITDICINTNTTNPPCNIDEMHISFARPDFDAVLVAVEGGTPSNPSDVKISVAHQNDITVTRTVHITAAGQITVE